MSLTKNEKVYIRDLAKQIREISRSMRQIEIVKRYKDINSLLVVRPPVAVHMPQDAYKKLFEIQAPIIQNDTFSWLEREFLAQLNRVRFLHADMPITDVFYTGLFFSVSDWMEGYKTVRANSNGTSNSFSPCIIDYADLKKMCKPQLTVDWKNTKKRFDEISSILGDILDIRLGSPFSMTCGWGESMIDQLVEMRGLEQIYYDLVDAPEFIHSAMQFMTEGKLDLLKQFKEQAALFVNNDRYLIGSCSYPFTDELPVPDMPNSVVEKNLWAFAQAQEFTGASADMLEEFVLPYQAKIVNKFGLSSYGCCEAMDKKINVISKHIKNLRILAISPYSDIRLAVSKCKGRYVMSCKMHPDLASHFNKQRTEEYLKRLVLDTNGCSITISFAEIMDYGNNANVFLELADIAQNTIDKYWDPL